LVSRLRPRDGVSRVASALVVYVPSPLPRWSCWVLIAPFPSSGSFPCEVVRSASTLLFSRPAQRLLTLQPAHSPNRLTILSIEGFRRLVALPPAPIATGWSDPCREGFAPPQELCLSTAHDFITTTFGFRFSVHTRIRNAEFIGDGGSQTHIGIVPVPPPAHLCPQRPQLAPESWGRFFWPLADH